MSAVATPQPTAVPMLELVDARPPTAVQVAAREMNRWMLWFGLPMVAAAVFVGAMFASGREWLIAPAGGLVVADVLVLVWLAMSSDTNGINGEPAAH
jgi:hypothetical protein